MPKRIETSQDMLFLASKRREPPSRYELDSGTVEWEERRKKIEEEGQQEEAARQRSLKGVPQRPQMAIGEVPGQGVPAIGDQPAKGGVGEGGPGRKDLVPKDKRKGLRPTKPQNPRMREQPSFPKTDQSSLFLGPDDIKQKIDYNDKDQVLKAIDQQRLLLTDFETETNSLQTQIDAANTIGDPEAAKAATEKLQQVSQQIDYIGNQVLPNLLGALYKLNPNIEEFEQATGDLDAARRLPSIEPFVSPDSETIKEVLDTRGQQAAEDVAKSWKNIPEDERERYQEQRREEIREEAETRPEYMEAWFQDYFDNVNWGEEPIEGKKQELQNDLKQLGRVLPDARQKMVEVINHDAEYTRNIIKQLRASGQRLGAAQDDAQAIKAEIQRLQNIPNQKADELEQKKQELESADPKGVYRQRLELGIPLVGDAQGIFAQIRDLMQQIQGLEQEIQVAPAKIERNIQWLQRQLQTLESDPQAWDSRQEEMAQPRIVEPKAAPDPLMKRQQEFEQVQQEKMLRGLNLQQRPRWEQSPSGEWQLNQPQDLTEAKNAIAQGRQIIDQIMKKEDLGSGKGYKTLKRGIPYDLLYRYIEARQNYSEPEGRDRYKALAEKYLPKQEYRKAFDDWYDSNPSLQDLDAMRVWREGFGGSWSSPRPGVLDRLTSYQGDLPFWERLSADADYYRNALNRVHSQIIADAKRVIEYFINNPDNWKDQYADQAMSTDYAIGALLQLVGQISAPARDKSTMLPSDLVKEKREKVKGEKDEEELTEDQLEAMYDEDSDIEKGIEEIEAAEAMGQNVDVLTNEVAGLIDKAISDAAVRGNMAKARDERLEQGGSGNLSDSPTTLLRSHDRNLVTPSYREITRNLFSIYENDSNAVIDEIGNINEYVVPSPETGKLELTRKGQTLAKRLHNHEIMDYVVDLIYTSPNFDDEENRSISDDLAISLRKTLLWNAYRLDPRFIQRKGAPTEKILDQMANLLYLDLVDANEQAAPYSLWSQWDKISGEAMERKEDIRQAIGRWLNGQALGMRQRKNRELWGSAAWTDEYKRWYNGKDYQSRFLKKELGIPPKSVKGEVPKEVWEQYFDRLNKWKRENPEPNDKYNLETLGGFSPLQELFQGTPPEDLEKIVDWLADEGGNATSYEPSNEDDQPNIKAINKEEQQFKTLEEFVKLRPEFMDLASFLFDHPYVFQNVTHEEKPEEGKKKRKNKEKGVRIKWTEVAKLWETQPGVKKRSPKDLQNDYAKLVREFNKFRGVEETPKDALPADDERPTAEPLADQTTPSVKTKPIELQDALADLVRKSRVSQIRRMIKGD